MGCPLAHARLGSVPPGHSQHLKKTLGDKVVFLCLSGLSRRLTLVLVKVRVSSVSGNAPLNAVLLCIENYTGVAAWIEATTTLAWLTKISTGLH